jgi:ring-1,2-phenylacetyl-CoA epoxidase subunit PaaC
MRQQKIKNSHLEYLQRLADNSLILGQRVSEWCGHAPVLEEDIALANIALDYIGQARLLLSHLGTLEGKGRDEDQLAFLRHEPAFRNLTICELPNHDFARTILRNFLFSGLQLLIWEALQTSSDIQLAAIAEKSIKETRYHFNHSGEWVVRLGDGTEVSHLKVQEALNYLWPYTNEFFASDETDHEVCDDKIGPVWSELKARWFSLVKPVIDEACLVLPGDTPFASYGKFGRHSEHLGRILAEMQYLQRCYPGAQW